MKSATKSGISSPIPQIPASAARLADALRQIYDRPQPPVPWRDGANLPLDDPTFSERMLAQHLDQSHGAASRPLREIRAQVQQMTAWLGLASGDRLFDVTCDSRQSLAELDISTPMAYTFCTPMA